MTIQLSSSHYLFMNLGERYQSAEVATFTDVQRTALRQYPDKLKLMIKGGLGLFLWGDNNGGKSYVAAALLKKAWSQYRVSGYWISAAALKDRIISDEVVFDGTETVMQRIRRVRFLVLDDLGKEHKTVSGFTESVFGSLLRERSDTKKVTVLTSNMNPKEFGEIYGRSPSQLLKACTYPVRLEGEDMRAVEAKKIKSLLEVTK